MAISGRFSGDNRGSNPSYIEFGKSNLMKVNEHKSKKTIKKSLKIIFTY